MDGAVRRLDAWMIDWLYEYCMTDSYVVGGNAMVDSLFLMLRFLQRCRYSVFSHKPKQGIALHWGTIVGGKGLDKGVFVKAFHFLA